MARLLLDLGPLAHLSDGEGPLRGLAMSDDEALVSSSGMGIVVDNGIITRIGDSENLRDEYLGGLRGNELDFVDINGHQVLEVGGRAVIPGLVDAHTHLLWGGDRSRELRWRLNGMSYADIAAKGGGIASTVAATREMSMESLLECGLSRMEMALRHGTTALEVKSGYGLNTESELRLLEAAVSLHGLSIDSTWLGAHAAPPNISRSDYFEEILSEQLPAVLDSGMARSADVFCEPGWFSIEETEEICKAAKSGGMDIRLHVDEFVDGEGLALAAELGSQSGDHAHWSSDEARAAANAANSMQCFLPATPYSMGETHFPPAQQCLDEEWAWCAASDFNPNCRTLSLPFIGSLLSQRMGIDPLASLVAVSRNSAENVMHDADLAHGQIVVGGAANLNILDSPHWETWCSRPGHSPFVGTLVGGEFLLH